MERAAFLALFCSALFAQDAIQVTTRLVQVNVNVEDKHGRPVAGLRTDDFVVLDGKKRESIRFFSRHIDDTERAAAEPVPEGTFTNRVETRTAVPVAVTAMVLDQLGTPLAQQHHNRNLILKMLEGIDPRHRVALYVLGTQLRVVHDFTSDTESLIAALRQVRGTPTSAGTRPDRPAETSPEMPGRNPSEPKPQIRGYHADDRAARQEEFEKLLAEIAATNAIVDAQRRASIELSAIEGVAHHLARVPGRKNLVWVSSGFPVTFFEYRRSPQAGLRPVHMLREFERTARALMNSNVAVYSVHAGDSGGSR